MNHFTRGLAAIGNFFAPAFGLVRSVIEQLDALQELSEEDVAQVATEEPKRRGGYSGAKLERKAAKGRVGMATLR